MSQSERTSLPPARDTEWRFTSLSSTGSASLLKELGIVRQYCLRMLGISGAITCGFAGALAEVPLLGWATLAAAERLCRDLRKYQESAVVLRAIETVCPFTGRAIQSHASLPMGAHNLVYEFDSHERFYLGFYGPVDAGLPFLWFPESRLIVTRRQVSEGVREGIERELSSLALHLGQSEHLLLKHRHARGRKLVLEIGHGNFAHHVANELQALDRLLAAGALEQVDEIWVYRQPVCDLSFFFSGIGTRKIRLLNPEEQQVCSRLARVLKENAFPLKVGDNRLGPRLRSVLAEQFKRRAGEIREAFQLDRRPAVLWVSVKCRDRTLVDQQLVVADLCKRLAADTPGLTVVLAGVCYPWDYSDRIGGRIFSPDFVDEHQQVIDAVRDLLRDDPVDVVGLNAVTLPEAFAWSMNTDAYFAHWGSIQHMVGWFSNGRGLVHGNKSIVNNSRRIKKYASRMGDNRFSVLPAGAVDDAERTDFDSRPRGAVSMCNYRLNTDIASAMLQQLLREVRRERHDGRNARCAGIGPASAVSSSPASS